MILARRLTFQLTPLLDLLLIVIFAQFMEVQQTEQRREAEFDQDLGKAEDQVALLKVSRAGDSAKLKETRKRAKQSAQQMAELQSQLADLQSRSAKQKLELTAELSRVLKQRDVVGQVVADLFRVPDQLLRQTLKPRSPTEPLPTEEELAELRKKFRQLSEQRGQEIVRHLLTYQELRKRCDIWEVYVAENGSMAFRAGKTSYQFRAATPESFEATLFKRYKSLPQPKGLVIMLLSYGDTKALYYEVAVDGLPRATERMRADSNGRSRFEYAIIGYNPQGPAPLEP